MFPNGNVSQIQILTSTHPLYLKKKKIINKEEFPVPSHSPLSLILSSTSFSARPPRTLPTSPATTPTPSPPTPRLAPPLGSRLTTVYRRRWRPLGRSCRYWRSWPWVANWTERALLEALLGLRLNVREV
jgi:hypothetical protein